MKNILTILVLTILVLTISVNLCGQEKMNEQRCIKEDHIDFSKEIIIFALSGEIEIDGHTFLNDTSKCKIMYKADLDQVIIYNDCTMAEYAHRVCGVGGCKIIHLTEAIFIDDYIVPKSWIDLNQLPYIIHDSSDEDTGFDK